MATGINKQVMRQQVNANILSKTSALVFSRRSSKSTAKIKSVTLDSFQRKSANDMLKQIVERVRSILTAPSMPTFSLPMSTRQSWSFQGRTLVLNPAPPELTQQEISQGVTKAGGMEAIAPWLVDGKTKISVNGMKRIADIAGTGQITAPAETVEDAFSQAEESLKRFDFTSADLNRPIDELRADLKKAAALKTAEGASAGKNTALAIEYALEDAFAKLATYESLSQGSSIPGSDQTNQQAINQAQAGSIKKQLNLGSGATWGIDSIGEDLAVFGMDFTALDGDPKQLTATIQQKANDMVAELDKRSTGTESEYIKSRNQITGACSRLVNGIQGATVVSRFSASASASASVSVTGNGSPTHVAVGGSRIDAGFIISVGNVIVDPLVLDMHGDGIDLSAAEEGVEFDMDGTGEKKQMGFVRGDDALLFVDSHGDGIVHDGKQLFGNNDGHANGFEKLREYDDNGDGVIDENDAIYDKLMIWQEKTEDGVCERAETTSLRNAGISSINLGYQNVREDDGKGNLISQTGSFTRDDGSSGYAADVWLRSNSAAGQSEQG